MYRGKMQRVSACVEAERERKPSPRDRTAHRQPREVCHGDVREKPDPQWSRERHQVDARDRGELERESGYAQEYVSAEQPQAALLQVLHPGLEPTQRKLLHSTIWTAKERSSRQ